MRGVSLERPTSHPSPRRGEGDLPVALEVAQHESRHADLGEGAGGGRRGDRGAARLLRPRTAAAQAGLLRDTGGGARRPGPDRGAAGGLPGVHAARVAARGRVPGRPPEVVIEAIAGGIWAVVQEEVVAGRGLLAARPHARGPRPDPGGVRGGVGLPDPRLPGPPATPARQLHVRGSDRARHAESQEGCVGPPQVDRRHTHRPVRGLGASSPSSRRARE